MKHASLCSHVTLVDGHVHVHKDFDTDDVLWRAHDNLGRAARALGCASYTGVLGLVETSDCDWFERLARRDDASLPGWRIAHLDEACSLEVTREHDGARLLVMAGGQIVTSERLEVLSLFSAERVEDGLPVRETVRRVLAGGGIPVIPWGFGKWWGKRGRTLTELLSAEDLPHVRLGDNGGRTRWLPGPSLLRLAANTNRQILSGSDPLPFRDDAGRAGSFGFAVELRCSARRPAESLKAALGRPDVVVTPFGQLMPGLRFAVNQIRMQVRKRALS
jgi:hypothetical protein